MSNGSNLEQFSQPPQRERNWLPLAIASGVVVLAVILLAVLGRGKASTEPASPTAPLDAYSASLQVDSLQMSESANLAGGKVTYIDGLIANQGSRTVIGITVQVLYRNAMGQVAQNESQPMKLIRTRQPYIDLEPVSAQPLKPGDQKTFRLTFDGVTPNWNGVMPELRLLHVDLK